MQKTDHAPKVYDGACPDDFGRCSNFRDCVCPRRVVVMEQLEQRIRQRGYQCVMVRRSGKLSGFLSKAESCVQSWYRCWNLKRMRCGVELALAQGSVTLGDQQWQQQHGIPVCGMVSSAFVGYQVCGRSGGNVTCHLQFLRGGPLEVGEPVRTARM